MVSPRPRVHRRSPTSWVRPDVRARAIAATLLLDPRAHSTLAAALLAADADRPRVDLAQAVARLPAGGFAIAVGVCLARGDADVTALVARALAPRWADLPPEAQGGLTRLLEAARVRHPTHLVMLTIDEVLAQCPAPAAIQALLQRLSTLPPKVAAKVLAGLSVAPDDAVRAAAPALLHAATLNPRLLVAASRLLERVGPLLDDDSRVCLFRLAEATFAEPAALPTWRLALLPVLEACFAWPSELDALCLADLCDVAPVDAQARACRVLALVGTEDAALTLLELVEQPGLQDVATAAVRTLCSPVVTITDVDGALTVEAGYLAPDGARLVLEPQAMTHPVTGEHFALDARGLPLPASACPHGVCTCCVRPRQLMVDAGLQLCPHSGMPHRPVVVAPAPPMGVFAPMTPATAAAAAAAAAAVAGPFPPSGLPEWRFMDDAHLVNCLWTMVELRDATELSVEGALMRHCVGSLHRSCRTDRWAIFSLRRQRLLWSTRALTVELCVPERVVTQAKGRFNRAPTWEEFAVLEQWALENQLRLSIGLPSPRRF